jgi:hypothetical protein
MLQGFGGKAIHAQLSGTLAESALSRLSNGGFHASNRQYFVVKKLSDLVDQ